MDEKGYVLSGDTVLYRNISSDVHGGAGQPGDEDLASVYGSNRMTWSSHKTFSRMKDFYDLYVLARDFTFDGNTLVRSIQATFKRRRTDIPIELVYEWAVEELREELNGV